MGRHRSAKAERRRAEIKLEKAKHEFMQLMLGYLESEEGQQLLAALKSFDLVAVSDPAVADRGRLAFVRHHIKNDLGSAKTRRWIANRNIA